MAVVVERFIYHPVLYTIVRLFEVAVAHVELFVITVAVLNY